MGKEALPMLVPVPMHVSVLMPMPVALPRAGARARGRGHGRRGVWWSVDSHHRSLEKRSYVSSAQSKESPSPETNPAREGKEGKEGKEGREATITYCNLVSRPARTDRVTNPRRLPRGVRYTSAHPLLLLRVATAVPVHNPPRIPLRFATPHFPSPSITNPGCFHVVPGAPGPRAARQSGGVGCFHGRSRMWGLGVSTTQRPEFEVDSSKMEVAAKVLICGGLVAVVAYGIYTCSCRLRRARSYHEPNDHPTLPQRPKDLVEPLLEDSEVPLGLGQTWRGSRGRNSVPDLERGLETAVTAASDPQNGARAAARKEASPAGGEISKFRAAASSNLTPQNCKIQLEVVGGPVAGLRAEKQAVGTNAVLALGRLPQNDLVLNDPEVSGKHVVISWNAKLAKWELVDMGSLNGTLVNSRPVGAAHKANVSVRQRGQPTALANGDIITLGSSSNVLVRILASHLSIASAPFEVGVASDPMSYRRGGRPLPMEDVCLCEWPLRGAHEVPFGIFCVFDGHGGSAAAEEARRVMPQKMAELLAVEETRMGVLTKNEASDVLRTAFHNTEESLDYPYEGCTATVLLLWPDATSGFLAQCANLGDSHCIVSDGDQQLLMTEDHRLTSKDERLRLLESGKQLKEGENRLAGMNIARALGDKFLKEEEAAFSAEPYISNVFRLSGDGLGLVVMASDGLWDVLSPRRALQLAAEARERTVEGGLKSSQASAQGIAKMLVDQAREKRTKDNTSVVVIDFATKNRSSFHTL